MIIDITSKINISLYFPKLLWFMIIYKYFILNIMFNYF